MIDSARWRPDIALLRVTLVPCDGDAGDAAAAQAVHAVLLKLLERRDAELSRTVHDMAVNPMALWSETRDPATGREDWRLGLLHGRVVDAFSEALTDAAVAGQTVDLDRRPFRIAAVTQAGPALTYAELLARAEPAETIALRFLTPLVFINKGAVRREPAPRVVFGSLLRRWNAFAAGRIELDEATVVERVRLTGARLTADPRVLFGRRFLGSIGTAAFAIDGDDEFRRRIAALAAYAAYCGTGAKTALGMGRTARIA